MRVLSVHAPLASVLAERPVCRVVSVHRRAVNLELPDGEWCTVAAPALGNGPATVVAEADWPLPWRVGDFYAAPSVEDAVRWEPPAAPVFRPGPAVDLKPAPGLAGGAWAELSAPGLAALAAGAWAEAAAALVGLGPGLTPSGDDLLAGYVLALWRSRLPGAVGLAGALLGVAPEATTPLSRHLLRWAARGVAGEHHLAWLDALLAGAPVAPDRVLAHGATSGADWIAGALLALHQHGGGDLGGPKDREAAGAPPGGHSPLQPVAGG